MGRSLRLTDRGRPRLGNPGERIRRRRFSVEVWRREFGGGSSE